MMCGSEAASAATPHPIIPGFERLLAKPVSTADRVTGGRLLLGELNCTSCHKTDAATAPLVNRKRAPILDGVGSRIRVKYLRKFLADPHATKPGTTMPNLFADSNKEERTRRVEALVHFLSTTGGRTDKPADPKFIGNGRNLFHRVGCTACHVPQEGEPLKVATAVPLPVLHEKYSVDSLTAFLKNPLTVRPSGRMPAPLLNDNESRDVAHYLMRNLTGIVPTGRADLPKVPYSYYEGNWMMMPDFAKLKPKTTGIGAAFDIGLQQRGDQFALKWDAVFEVSRAGDYVFSTNSDDGSLLWIDGKLVVNNDGVHPPTTKSGSVKLKAGLHRITVAIFEAGGGEELAVTVTGPGLPQQPLSNIVAADEKALAAKKSKQPKKKKPADPDVFVFDADLAKEGRKLFSSLGCAACHDLKENGKPILAKFTGGLPPKSLAGLKGQGGCLAEKPPQGLPRYALNAAQQTSLTKAIVALKTSGNTPFAARPSIHDTMLTFNCYACHVRDKVGGVEQARNALFQTTQKEMGDEGRIPPHLDGVGAKLTDNWLKQILNNGANDRPYMHVRMPKFGTPNVGHLATAFQQTDPEQVAKIPEIALAPRRIKSTGRHMSGNKVFGCIKCHTFNGQRALGVQSIDMAIMTKRLKHDWFHNYMLNPQAFRAGTRMPAAWPQGNSTLRDVLDGSAGKQVEAIWQYLADGGKAAAPYGLNPKAIELVATTEPVMYRNFIQGAGPRAIAVAYPAKVNIAFDADEMRLALIWQGAFVDAAKHWIGRGPGFQMPLGDSPVTLPNGPSFATLDKPNAAWPSQSAKELGFKFRGYRFTSDRHPIFRYTYMTTRIEDFITAVKGMPTGRLKRTLDITTGKSAGNLWFRAAVGNKIESSGKGRFVIDNDVTITVQADTQPVLVKVGNQWEVRVPIAATGKTTIVQEFRW